MTVWNPHPPILLFHIPFFSSGGMLEFIPAAPGEKQVNSPGHTITSEDVLAAATMTSMNAASIYHISYIAYIQHFLKITFNSPLCPHPLLWNSTRRCLQEASWWCTYINKKCWTGEESLKFSVDIWKLWWSSKWGFTGELRKAGERCFFIWREGKKKEDKNHFL